MPWGTANTSTAEAPIEAAIFNAGGNWPRSFLEIDGPFLEEMWRVNALAGLFFAKAAIGVMYYLRCIHPPGGATALSAVMGGEGVHALGYQFVVTPVLIS